MNQKRIIKIAIIVILTALLIGLITSCLSNFGSGPNIKYTCRQSTDQIVSIDILRKEYDSLDIEMPMYILKSFEPEEFDMVLDGLSKVPVCRPLNPPRSGIGLYIVRITYQNGEAELLGNYNTGYVSVDGEVDQDRLCFDTIPYYALISELLEKEITDYTYG